MSDNSSTPPTSPPRTGSVYKNMLRGSLWALGQNFSFRIIGLFNTVILARLLTPDDFGLVTMAAMMLGFLSSFVDLGHATLLLRQPDATREHCDTTWTFSLLRGLLVAIFLALLSPWVASFFRDERVISVTLIMATNSLLMNSYSVGVILLRKELQFGKEFYFNLACRLVTLVVTLSFAFWLRNYWAIVIGSIIGNVYGLIFSYRVHPYRPKISFAKAREYLKFSIVMIPLNTAFFFTARVDTFVVGRLSTASMLGVYNIASELATMVTIDLMQQISRGLYPNFATLLQDRAKLAEAYLNAVTAMITVSVAFGLGFFAVSDDFVHIILGEKWLAAIPLLQWLAIAGVLRGIDYCIGTTILTVTGFERIAAIIMWIRLAIYLVCSILGGIWYGQMGVAIGMVIGSALMIPIVMMAVKFCIKIRLRDFLRALSRPIPSGLAMVAVLSIFNINQISFPILRLVLDVIVGTLVFGATSLALWHFAGRPVGIESRVLGAIQSKLGSFRK